MILEKVEYSKTYPHLNPAKLSDRDYFKKSFSIKSEYWDYEEEERLIFRESGDVVLKFPKNVFSEITLGLKMPDDHKREIMEVAKNEFEDIKCSMLEKLIGVFIFILKKLHSHD